MQRKHNYTFYGSQDAYGAVAYLRFENDTITKCELISAKTKVAPQKPMRIHRLELQAAVLDEAWLAATAVFFGQIRRPV